MKTTNTRKSKKLQAAKNKLILNHPFYSHILLKSEMFFTTDVPTAATDGKDFFINENYMNSLNPFELTSMLMHEVLHKVFLHSLRLNGRDPKKWNIACDYTINPIIKNTGLPIKDEWLYDKKWEGKTADYVYANLPPDDPSQNLPPAPDHLIPAPPDMSKSDKRQLEQEIKQQIAEATSISKQSGNLPGDLEKFLEEVLQPKVNWADTLRHLVQRAVSGNERQSWSRLNRKFIAQDILLPTTIGENTPPLIVMFDTSGSIFGEKSLVEKFTAEIQGIIDDMNPEEVHVIYTDTDICGHDIFAQGDDLKINLKGGGGTDFKKFFNYVLEQDIQASAIIAMTDLYASGIPDDFDIETIWVTYGNNKPKAPFGEIIKLDD